MLKKKETNTNYSSSSFKNVGGIRAKEVRVKQLRVLVALPEDLGSVPSMYMATHDSSKGSHTLF